MSRPWKILMVFALLASRSPVQAYGPSGHEIVGGIADKVIANSPAAKKIYALTDGITLERTSVMADEIKSWDKNGVDDANSFPHYADHPAIDKQLRDFWRANPPTPDPASPIPSHHWFHYTDVPVLNPQKYADGKTGRTSWDVVHMIGYCVDVLRGQVPENNPRRITKQVAVILLAHYVGDIHQPLHVGAEYFDQTGKPVDPDKNQPGIEDEGGNSIFLKLTHGSSDELAHKGLKLHGFWDADAVMANLPPIRMAASKEERFQIVQHAQKAMIGQLTDQQPPNWRAPSGLALNKYGEFWADEILPIAREAHQRLRFVYMHPTVDQGRNVIAGDARENRAPDGVAYADWAARIVRDELQKAGWRLADLLSQAVEAMPVTSSAAIATPEPIVASPGKSDDEKPVPAATAESQLSSAGAASANVPREPDFGGFPDNYKHVIMTWLQKYGLDASRVDWQTEPKPAEMPNGSGQRLSGYVVIFNTPDREQMKTRSVLIRDGVVVVNNGF
jgi:hypothetical protein